jgi:hypothetical protein
MRFNHTIFLTLFLAGALHSEPIVITGKMLPENLGAIIKNIRITDHRGASIPFQIDEVEDNDYVCTSGKEPNIGNGLLDTADEIVFLWEDADTIGPANRMGKGQDVITVTHGRENRYVYLSNDASIPLSHICTKNAFRTEMNILSFIHKPSSSRFSTDASLPNGA